MPAKKSTKNAGKTSVKRAAPAKKSQVFTEEERAAMREHAEEQKAAARRGGQDDEGTVLAKIAAMAPEDRALAERIHSLVRRTAPDLTSRLWYGMPAYAKDGAVVCFFQDAKKFKSRYATLGFSDKAKLDDGEMWPTSFALMALTAVDEARIAALIRKAVS